MTMRVHTTVAGALLALLVGTRGLEGVAGAQAVSGSAGSGAVSGPVRTPGAYNLPKSRLAIEGYDPVAYFPEGGGAPAKGDERLEASENGVIYRFASQAHLDLFKANPTRYEPAHGGWCAYAMGKNGSKVEIDPRSFVVADGRLFLFYKDLFNDTRKSFLKDQAGLTSSADANWKALTGESPRGAYEDAIREVARSGVLDSAIKAGATAPDFTLTDASGQPVRLAELLKSGPVVLTWYGGGWCPYCTLHFRDYQRALPDIEAAGGRLVALSPDLPDAPPATRESHEATPTVLSDSGNRVARRYGILYRLPEKIVSALQDMPQVTSEASRELPLAATFVISTDSRIAYVFIDADYRKRAEPADIVAALKRLRDRR